MIRTVKNVERRLELRLMFIQVRAMKN